MIPRIIHRTLPEFPREDVAPIWDKVLANSVGWEHRTYQSPRNPDDWKITGPLFHLCSDRAEEADLVRFEALWLYGGVYLDSDMELTQSIEWVLNDNKVVAGWEDDTTIAVGLVASVPKHPAIGIMLKELMAHVANKDLGRSHAPKMATQLWKDRDDVNALPRKALYPYHYTEKETNLATFDWSSDPEVLAVHHWHASWVK